VSYIGALHHPYPYRASIGVVAPTQASAQVVTGLNGLPKQVLDAKPVADETTAVRQIKDQKLYTALIVNPAGTQDALLVANASGPALATAVTQIVTQADARQGRTVVVRDVVPLAPGDAEGLSSFYLAVGWCVGGCRPSGARSAPGSPTVRAPTSTRSIAYSTAPTSCARCWFSRPGSRSASR
jgi:hypothetical protein